ncbi:hypothetical protein VNO77_22066 [Canavalia gladiata]|uniref:KIB1-4 beta-propeller domain-containing protein n=1 Tax=Canavalia gladiata TaxID=3824 RepID=A0AAN9L232_CANGL
MAILSVPYAILPSIEDTHDDDIDNYMKLQKSVHRSILSVSEKKRCEWKNMFLGHPSSWCVGSSRDWLFLLDANGFPSLLNPSSAMSICLPNFPIEFIPSGSYFYYDPYVVRIFVSKAVLMHSPSPSQYTLVIIYGSSCKLAFCTEHGTWVQLHDAKRSYCDIVFLNNVLYALAEGGSVEAWEFRNNQRVPNKVFDVKPTMEIDKEERRQFPIDLFSTQMYLVISEGEFLLVKRYIGNFVTADGLVVYEGYSEDDGNEICPYRTKHFVVYKLDFTKINWEKKSSLHDQVLFLGANESTSLPAKAFSGCEANSIYFTDDRWQEMGLDYLYGGQDWGVFSLQDGSVKLLTPDENRLDPPPIWVVPTSQGFCS